MSVAALAAPDFLFLLALTENVLRRYDFFIRNISFIHLAQNIYEIHPRPAAMHPRPAAMPPIGI